MDSSADSLNSLKGSTSNKQTTSKGESNDAEMMDDNESGSAPIEMLSEFLSAVMGRDYEAALNYCKTILHYEPGNKIVQEFYPLILERIQQAKDGTLKTEQDSDENTEEDNSCSSKSASTGEFTSGSDCDNEDENGNSTSDDFSGTDGGWRTALNTDSDSTEKDDNEQDNNSNPTSTPTALTDACANQINSLSL